VPLLKKFAKVLVFVGVVWAGAALLNAFVFQTYYVNGLSMTPTLQDSDRLIVTKLGKTGASITGKKLVPNRGDIVVLSSEVSTYTASQHEQIIKRVVALPGERVTIQNGEVKIHNSDNPDGFNLNKELDLQLSSTYTVKPIDTTVPEGAVFVLGDNRTAGGSFDSRDFGPVNLDHIEGILWMRILPFTQIHIF
jgi:signal peptidase I